MQLKHIPGWNENSEFKFTKTNSAAKLAFFSHLSSLEFRAFVVLADKMKIPERKPSDLYNETILAALKSISPQIELVNIVIDGESGKNYRQKAKTYCEQNKDYTHIKQNTPLGVIAVHRLSQCLSEKVRHPAPIRTTNLCSLNIANPIPSVNTTFLHFYPKG